MTLGKKLFYAIIAFTATTTAKAQNDAQRVAELRHIIARADQQAAQTIVENSTFMFMNGMLGDVGAALDRMPTDVRDSEAGRKAIDLYRTIHLVDVGSLAPDFTLPTPDGTTVHFYDFIKDKRCVLLDFWASWCGWCRKENPSVKAAYDAYRDQGFDVLSVSVDEKDDAWRRALDEDRPTWPQAVDNGGTKQGLYQWYSLNGIPAIFLIDSKGYIVAKGLRGTKISETVEDYLKKGQ